MRLRDLSIIQYQNISPKPECSRLWLSTGAFQRQLDHISANGFHVLTMDEATDFMERKKQVPKNRPISLTFDNGFIDFYEHAYPLLLQHHFPGTLLISPDKVGTWTHLGSRRCEYLTWHHLKELAGRNVTIGAYADDTWNINHINEDTVERYIVEYKDRLEDHLGIPVRYFGVKEGIPGRGIRKRLISEGYRAFLTECPTNRRPNLYAIGRIQVDDDDFNIFLTKISRTYLFFKDKRSWKYIREYRLDKMAHRLSESFDRLRGMNPHR
ncbi:MAG: polysaccharide deacetylase family protein [Deltaproteobacteria bacterium]|nr:polysaccharide deacetylase family protein [Deltaproteobacteria bacterium]